MGALNKDDAFGDVAMAASNSCSDNMTVWKGTGYTERTFIKTSQSFTGAELPKEITTLQTDADGDGRPDALQAIMSATGAASTQAQNFAKTTLGSYNTDTNGNGVPDRSDNAGTLDNGSSLDTNNGQVDVGSFGANADAINSQIDTVVAGLGCGFGGGSCIASPLNWAPLAPGSVPTVMGYPMGNLTALTGVPIFAFPTSCTIVPVWPPCPVGAGGYLSPMNISQFRLFVTPTITGAVGAAICFGSNYGVGEQSNPK